MRLCLDDHRAKDAFDAVFRLGVLGLGCGIQGLGIDGAYLEALLTY